MLRMLSGALWVVRRMSPVRTLVCFARRCHKAPGPAEWRRLFSAEAARTVLESETEDDPSSVFRRIVMARSSVRGFENRAVPKEVLQDVLSLTLRSPSSFNINPYTIVMVQSSEVREALAACMLGPNQRRVREAPVSAIFAADLDPVKLVPRVIEMERRAGAAEHYLASLSFNVSFMAGQGKLAHAFKDIVTTAMSPLQPMPSVSSPEAWSFRDTAFASAWYMLAAAAHGLDTSPMEGLDGRRVKAALGIPERYAIPLVVATGYRKEGPERKSPRPPPETLVFNDRVRPVRILAAQVIPMLHSVAGMLDRGDHTIFKIMRNTTTSKIIGPLHEAHAGDFFLMIKPSIVSSGAVRDDLERAVFVADVGLVRMLLAERKVIKAGVPPVLVNRTDGIGRTALHKCGFDPQTRDLIILDRDCNRIAEMLLKAGSGVDVPDQKGWTPLAYAASLGFAQTAATLVQHGAQVDSRDEFGRTSLMKAVVNGHFSAMHTLLGLGADPSVADSSSGWTPLFFAVRNSMNAHWERLIKVLLARVADTIDQQDHYGRTVLMYAVSIGNVEIVRLLLRYGASIEVMDRHGYSAISLTDKDDVLQLLQNGIVVATERHVADWAAVKQVYPEKFQREEGILRVLEKLIAFESP